MKKRRWLIVCFVASLPVLWWQGALRSADVLPKPRADGLRPPLNAGYMGAGSCAAAACHNGHFYRGATGSEYSIWIAKDPHARAYQVLFDERSERMQELLEPGQNKKAHENDRCLKCHVAPGLVAGEKTPHAPYFKSDGVSCESCHGPARDWLALHHLDSWQTRTPAEKAALGMMDTASVVGRVKVCVACHVGAPGMDVDHDLIAAGHPRLQFEFTSFHASMPHHWPDAKDRDPSRSKRGRQDFEIQAWIVGQLTSTQAALELLAHRAEKGKVWPEFAEHDCKACHHDLQTPSWRQARTKPGQGGKLLWNEWYLAMPDAASMAFAGQKAQAVKELQALLHKGGQVDRKRIAAQTKVALKELGTLLQTDLPGQVNAAVLDALGTELASFAETRDQKNEDQVRQLYFALTALQQSQANLKLLAPPVQREALENLQSIFRKFRSGTK